jgi:hypothetical protein
VRYRQRVPQIEAVQIDVEGKPKPEPEWFKGAVRKGTLYWSGAGYWTLEPDNRTRQRVSATDWVILNETGELFSMADGEFHRNYERVPQ